jgi:uncharacterized protein YndB with AHSA1/START domain
MVNKLEVSRDIEAAPSEVYAALSDVTRMGEWSEECYSCNWHEGFDAPIVGATFDGHNRYGDHEWTTQGSVIKADPGRAFAFECSMMDFHYSTWGYRIEPTETGCKVTEWSEDLRARVRLGVQRAGLRCRRPYRPQPTHDEPHARSSGCRSRTLIPLVLRRTRSSLSSTQRCRVLHRARIPFAGTTTSDQNTVPRA